MAISAVWRQRWKSSEHSCINWNDSLCDEITWWYDHLKPLRQRRYLQLLLRWFSTTRLKPETAGVACCDVSILLTNWMIKFPKLIRCHHIKLFKCNSFSHERWVPRSVAIWKKRRIFFVRIELAGFNWYSRLRTRPFFLFIISFFSNSLRWYLP